MTQLGCALYAALLLVGLAVVGNYLADKIAARTCVEPSALPWLWCSR